MNHVAVMRRLFVFDFDGTLSPLVPDRSAAQLHPACRALLRALAGHPGNVVAVLSSRAIEDLVPRVPVPRVYLGGGSGLEWRLPGGHRVKPGDDAERARERARETLRAPLGRLKAFPGVEVEEKRWSAAVHYRAVLPEAVPMLVPLLEELRRTPGIRVFDGPAAAEVQFFPFMNKAVGVRRLCRILSFDPHGAVIVYAGDDDNDAVAMRWVLSRKGTAFAVGGRVRVPGARHVAGPAALARAVRALAFPSEGRRDGGPGRRDSA